MAISRAQLLKELLPGLNALFGAIKAPTGPNDHVSKVGYAVAFSRCPRRLNHRFFFCYASGLRGAQEVPWRGLPQQPDSGSTVVVG